MTFVCSLLAFYSVKNVMIFSFCCCNLSRLTEQGDFLREFFVQMFEMKQNLFIKPFPMRITLSEHKLGFQMRMKNMPRTRQELPSSENFSLPDWVSLLRRFWLLRLNVFLFQIYPSCDPQDWKNTLPSKLRLTTSLNVNNIQLCKQNLGVLTKKLLYKVLQL